MANGGKLQDSDRFGERKGDAARAERLRKALRDNLKRRKSQARGRTQASASPPHDSAGIVPDKSRD
jgi:hypothetical protein